jgi:uncharacterized protein YbcI
MATTEPPKRQPLRVDDADRETEASELTLITRAMIKIYKEHFGRGPKNAHSHYAGQNTIICVLEGTLTPVEKSLVELGELRDLQNLRQLFQAATEPTFRSVVEEITGRQTVGFMSGNDNPNDLASEIFVLAPGNQST